MILAPPRVGHFFAFCASKKPSPVGEGGPRQRWMRSYLKIENTSSVTLRVPPSPTGEGYSILPLILQTLSSAFLFYVLIEFTLNTDNYKVAENAVDILNALVVAVACVH